MTFSTFSISGLASGLDTTGIVNQLLALERAPVVRFEQRQRELQQVDDAWATVTTKLSALRTAVDKVKAATSFDAFVAVTSSHPEAVAATRTGTPVAGSLSFTVDRLASAHQVMFDGTFASAADVVPAGSFTVTQGGTSHTVTSDGTKTLAAVAKELSDNLAGLTAQVVQGDSGARLVLTAKTTGAAEAIALSDVAAAPVGLDGLTELRAAADARLTLNTGDTVTRSTNTITDLVHGLTLQLEQADPLETVTVTTTRDSAAAKAAVQQLVDALNGVLSTVKDLTRYDAAANTARVLQGDDTARRLVVDLRHALSSTVAGLSGDYTAAGAVGVKLTRDGLAEVDPARLERALATDFDAVARLFSDSDAADGVAGALDMVLRWAEGDSTATDENVAKGAIRRARDTLSGEISRYDERISDFEVRLTSREVTLRKKFAALESALANVQSQGAWLSGMLGQQSQG